MRKYIRNILFLCVVSVCFTCCKRETKAEGYAREARNLTMQCPMSLDPYTQMDSLVYGEAGNEFVYYYTVMGLDGEQLKGQREALQGQLLDRLINAVEMRPYMEDNMTFKYVYRLNTVDNDSLVFTFTPDVYK